MCGIAGVVAWRDRCRVTRDLLSRMNSRIAHRGPDGEGLFLNHEDDVSPDRPQAGLAHRRLAIIDPDPRADQPFTDGRGRWTVFNGEVYNFRDLRRELSALLPDYEWKTDCDTEVLLAGYAAWGPDCVKHFNGMYAFAVWDEPRGELFLARDRMGQKPLYVAEVAGEGGGPGAVAFASELPALREVPWVDVRIRPVGLFMYLRWGYVPDDVGIYEGVRQIPPSTYKLWRRDSVTAATAFFSPNARGADEPAPAGETPVQTTRRLLTLSVRRQLVADVPLGCFLSGGVDSSVVAAAMKASVPEGQPVKTFSIGFDDPRYDETEYAAMVAQHLGTEHHQFVVRPDAATDLPKLAATFGEPFADSSALPTHYLSRETRKHVKVALSGDGGDELFGGYDRYRALTFSQNLRRRFPAPLLHLAAVARHALPGVHPKSRLARAKRFLSALHLPPGDRYARYVELFDEPTSRKLMKSAADVPATNAGDFVRRPLEEYLRQNGCDAAAAAMAVDRVTYLPGDLLTKVDRAAMLHALEVRSPYMDHELVRFAAGLPSCAHYHRRRGKRLLCEAFKADLPEWVFGRRKMGFAVPVGDWFRGDLRPMLHDHLFAADSFAAKHLSLPTVTRLVEQHDRRSADHSQRLYALLMLELWAKAAQMKNEK